MNRPAPGRMAPAATTPGEVARQITGGDLALAVAAAARLAARAGLLEAFGHVSQRDPGGGFVITTTEPLLAAGPGNTRHLDDAGNASGDASGVPLEAPLHAAIYAARPDVGAIVRTHSPATVVAGVDPDLVAPPLLHGLGGMSGEIAIYPDPQLIDDRARGEAAAAALDQADCLIMRGNGSLATGRDLPDALVRAWFFEERLRVWLEAGRPSTGIEGEELVMRSQHWSVEAARAWAWLAVRFGER